MEDEQNDFLELKKLLESDDWPEAVYPIQIADENSESDKEERAESIAELMLPKLDGVKFLDFGCGEGHVANFVSEFATLSVGYEIKPPQKSVFSWEDKKEKMLLTTDFEKVNSEGPYDVILMYDVIDHIREETQVEALARAKRVLAGGGKIYARCHPWSGRHGGHNYRIINKAFVHLVFTEEELAELGSKSEYQHKFVRPLAAYEDMIKSAGLTIESGPEIDRQEVEIFFEQNPIIKNRIIRSMNADSWTKDCPLFQMSQCFVDYVLKS